MNELAPTSESLILMEREQIRELVRQLRPEQRAPWSKLAKAACHHLRDALGDYDRAFGLACEMCENWRLLGEVIPRLIVIGKPKGTAAYLTLGKLGVTKNQSSLSQKLAKTAPIELQKRLKAHYDKDKGELPGLWTASRPVPHVSQNSGENEWYTPAVYIEAAKQVMGEIDLDPASSAKAQETVGARVWYDKDENGLEQDWTGRVWLNPPYASGLIDKFMAKLRESFDSRHVDAAISLTNNATDTDWFGGAAESASAICHVAKRIKFLNADGNPELTPLQGQICLYFGHRPEAFVDSFSAFGEMWVKP